MYGIALLMTFFAGCRSISAEHEKILNQITEEPTSVLQPAYSQTSSPDTPIMPSDTPPEEDKSAEICWNPYTISTKYAEAYGEWVVQNYYAVLDAIFTDSDVAENCAEGDIFYLNEVLRNSFPPYAMLISAITYEDGRVYLEYRQNDAERQKTLEAFKKTDRIFDKFFRHTRTG